MSKITLHHGDCREVMAGMEPESIGAIVTDPPYGLEFMGKAWDHGVPGVPFWSGALRVLKPGGHLLAFGGTRTYHRLACAIEDAGFEIRDCLMWLYGSGFPKSLNLKGEWHGYGTALKPAWEPIIVARKPLSGTVAANVQTHGTGALNIDGCRIGTEARHNPPVGAHRNAMMPYEGKDGPGTDVVGRWPANLLLDEESAAILDAQSGELKSGAMKGGTRRSAQDCPGSVCYGTLGGNATNQPIEASTGGASRFYYCAKASKADRDEDNHHPTVKPTSLMRWLVRLVTPPAGVPFVVLDPFTGSGSTGKACAMEGVDFVGIEQNQEYLEIARRRCRQEPSLFSAS